MTAPATIETTAETLPTADQVGCEAVWVLPSGPTSSVTVYARFLGHATSRRDQHASRHQGLAFAKPNTRCGACRWFEPRIFRELDQANRYLIHYAGLTSVPGETARTRHEWVRSGYEVVEALTTRRRDPDRPPAKCPVCDGTGLVSRPPGIAGDQVSWTSNGTSPYECRACAGAGVLHTDLAFLTTPAARVLSQAAAYDVEINDAYVNRATP